MIGSHVLMACVLCLARAGLAQETGSKCHTARATGGGAESHPSKRKLFFIVVTMVSCFVFFDTMMFDMLCAALEACGRAEKVL